MEIRRFLLVFGFALSSVVLSAQPRDALAMFRQARYSEAVEITLDELQTNPRNMDSYTVLGWSLNALGRFAEALSHGNRGLQVSPFDSRVVAIVAEAHFNLTNFDQSLEFAQRYVTIAPTGNRIAEMYYYMGEVFVAYGELNHADIAFSTALFYRSNIANWWARLGAVREQLRDWSGAAAAYRRATGLTPNHVEAGRGLERVLAQIQGT